MFFLRIIKCEFFLVVKYGGVYCKVYLGVGLYGIFGWSGVFCEFEWWVFSMGFGGLVWLYGFFVVYKFLGLKWKYLWDIVEL